MKLKSNTATATGSPSMVPVPVSTASPSPPFLIAALIRSLYFFESLNLRKSMEFV